MAWSTRQLADLAGTSLRTVRHYHEVGLLAEPERRSNGYKSYGVAHLVRLLHIRRLTDLGFSLTQISEMGEEDEHPEEALRRLDAELAATIERLQRVRGELSVILRHSARTDLPTDLAAAGRKMSDADRSMMVVLSRLSSPSAMTAYKEMMDAGDPEPTLTEFDDLLADADEQTREALARRLAPYVRDLRTENPAMGELKAGSPAEMRFARQSIGVAIKDLYNSAQIDVMVRVERLINSPE
ncbi:helix-turn-helix domain-containing protein [Actinophytocola sediminis]